MADSSSGFSFTILTKSGLMRSREAVPEIIARLAKDYQHNVELFGKDQECYSPALRKLAGRPFGEHAKPWQEWLANQAGPSGATRERLGHIDQGIIFDDYRSQTIRLFSSVISSMAPSGST